MSVHESVKISWTFFYELLNFCVKAIMTSFYFSCFEQYLIYDYRNDFHISIFMKLLLVSAWRSLMNLTKKTRNRNRMIGKLLLRFFLKIFQKNIWNKKIMLNTLYQIVFLLKYLNSMIEINLGDVISKYISINFIASMIRLQHYMQLSTSFWRNLSSTRQGSLILLCRSAVIWY